MKNKDIAIEAASNACALAFAYTQAAAEEAAPITQKTLGLFRSALKSILSISFLLDIIGENDVKTEKTDWETLEQILGVITQLQGEYFEASAQNPNYPKAVITYTKS